MANTKRIMIAGEMPFDANDHYTDMIMLLGQLNMPAFGLRIRWAQAPAEWRPNSNGGRTAVYHFVVEGEEAISTQWLERFERSLTFAGGMIHRGVARDIDEGTEVWRR